MRELLREVGQRFLIGFDGQAASADVKRMIRDFGVGSVILFDRNVDSPEQVAELVRELQAIARDAGHALPLLVSVDQEGGKVARLKKPWTIWPPLRGLGRIGNVELSRRMGAELARELHACGIRLDFAPVVDVDSNPKNPIIGDRAFSHDPQEVAKHAAAMIQGLQDGGVAACAKHFPGHGDTDKDSHLDLPVIDHSPSRLDEVEYPPFKRAIEADVATIMIAHLLARELDDKWPATLSPTIVQGILRERMKYEGVILADDLEMKAVSERWPAGFLGVQAARAGSDLLVYCTSHHAQVDGFEAVVRAIESEELPWKQHEASVLRMRRLKERFLLPWTDPDPKKARLAAGRGEAVALAEEIGQQGGLRA